MALKIINKTILALIILFLVVLVGFLVINAVFPIPNLTKLLPDKVIAYLDISNFNEALSSIPNSEFAKLAVESPLWGKIKTSRLWAIYEQNLSNLQQQGLDNTLLNRLIGKHAVLALCENQGSEKNAKLGLLLISELSMSTRLIIASGQIERSLTDGYVTTHEKYKGFRLVTIQSPEWKYTYAFAGRAGLLSDNVNIIKKTIDDYKNKNNGLATMPKFGKVTSDLPLSDTYFFINAEKILEYSHILIDYGINIDELAFLRNISLWAGAINSNNGELSISSFMLNRKTNENNEPTIRDAPLSERLPLPDKTMAFTTHKNLNPEVIFKWMEKIISPRFFVLRQAILPVVDESLAEIAIAPDTIQYQTMPSFALFMRVRNKLIAENAIRQFKEVLQYQSSGLAFEEIDYGGAHISYSSSFPGIYLPIGIGFTIIKDDLLVIATDISAIKVIIDTSNGKIQPITKQNDYINAMTPFNGKSDNVLFINLTNSAPIAQQLSKLYLFQGMLTGKRVSEKHARNALLIADNAFIMRAWSYLCAVWYPDQEIIKIKVILKK